MSEMVERVARALAWDEVLAALQAGRQVLPTGVTLDALEQVAATDPVAWRAYERQAAAAIAAVRASGEEALKRRYGRDQAVLESTQRLWRAVMDETLR